MCDIELGQFEGVHPMAHGKGAKKIYEDQPYFFTALEYSAADKDLSSKQQLSSFDSLLERSILGGVHSKAAPSKRMLLEES